MKKLFITLLLILIALSYPVKSAAYKRNLTVISGKDINFSLKLSKPVYKPGEKMIILATVKPTKDTVNDFRTTVKITDYKDNVIFKRTYFENKLNKKFVYKINRNVYLKPGGYKIFAKVSSYQKLIRKTELDFGVIPVKNILNLSLIFNISTQPLLNPKGNINKYTKDTINKLSAFSSKKMPKNIYSSISPLLLNELKNISTGYKEQTKNGKIHTISEDDNIPRKAKDILKKLNKLNDSRFSFNQTFSIADISSAPKDEIGWQIKSANKKPFITNSQPAKYLAESLKPKILLFNTKQFIFAKYKNKQLIGIDVSAGNKLNNFTKSSLYRFIAYSAEEISRGKGKMIIMVDGLPTQKFLKSMINTFKKTKIIKISRIPGSSKEYKHKKINLSSKKATKTKLYRLIEDFEKMTGPNNYYFKKVLINYLKFRHQPFNKDTKSDFSSYITELINKHFNMFSFKPQIVTLTTSEGKVPIGIYSKANYKTNLKLKIKTKDFKTFKVRKLIVKPGENAIVIPVKAVYSGKNNIDITLLAGNHIIGKNSIPVNVILPSTVHMYLYLFLTFAVIVIISAFIFREVRHRKI